ncbi:hypothetical protein J4442_03335 [Candidatus Woesearchaeota archaeon]|nr:hypothetical protein [Candidatus Woesearchaeota archaeon]
MPERLQMFKEVVEGGDYRPLLRSMSAVVIAGLFEIVQDPVFADQACEVLSGRRPIVVHTSSLPYTNDSILDLYR